MLFDFETGVAVRVFVGMKLNQQWWYVPQ